MGWPKGQKRTDKHVNLDTVAPPVVSNEVVEVEHPFVFSSQHCKTCGHSTDIHYEGRDRQCNTSGCRCFAFK